MDMDVFMWIEDPLTDGTIEIESDGRQRVERLDNHDTMEIDEQADDEQSDDEESDDSGDELNTSQLDHSYASTSTTERTEYDFEGDLQVSSASLGDRSERRQKALQKYYDGMHRDLRGAQRWDGEESGEESDESGSGSSFNGSDGEEAEQENTEPAEQTAEVQTSRKFGSKAQRQDKMVALLLLPQLCSKKCIKAEMFEEVGAHRTAWRDKSLKQQEAWIFEQLRGPLLRAGPGGQVQMAIGGDRVCQKCWRAAMGVTSSRFYHIIQRMKNDGVIRPAPCNYAKKGVVHPKTELAICWMDDHFKRNCDVMPDSRSRRLPVTQTRQSVYALYDAEMKAGNEEIIKFKHFRRVWRKHFKDVVAVKRHRFSQCTRCSELLFDAGKAVTEEARQRVERRKIRHLKIAADERVKYSKHIKKAISYAVSREGTSCISISIDGMDQAKTDIPNFRRKPKSVQNSLTCPTHVTGVKIHGFKTLVYVDYTQFRKGANLCCSILIDALQRVLSTHERLPDVLYLQFDNAGENKNKFLLALCCFLVERQVFKKIKIGFMIVGHTHCDIDQYFSRLSVRINKGVKNGNVYTGEQLIEAINTAVGHPNDATGIVLKTAYDVKAWFEVGGHMDKVDEHSKPRCFRIKLENGKAVVRTKRRSTDVEWLSGKNNKDQVVLKSHPSIAEIKQIVPQYDKLCLENEVGRQGLKHALNAYYDFMDEEDISWWKAFLATIESEDHQTPAYVASPLEDIFAKFLDDDGVRIERPLGTAAENVMSDESEESDAEDYRLVIGGRKRRFTHRKEPGEVVELVYQKNDFVLLDDVAYQQWPLVGQIYELPPNAERVKILWYTGKKTGKWDMWYQNTDGGKKSRKEDKVPVVEEYSRGDIWSDGFALIKKSQKLPKCVLDALKVYNRKTKE